MIIGVDIDGVLADFNSSFIDLIVKVTGEDKFPPRPFDIPTWHYPQHFGYSEDVMEFHNGPVWSAVRENPWFWFNLKPYPGTAEALLYLLTREYLLPRAHGDELYFVTARVGVHVKQQSERWLKKFMPTFTNWHPTVLIASNKAMVASALGFDVYIDDRWENCENVRVLTGARTFLMDRPWNADAPAEEYGIIRTHTVVGIADKPLKRIAA
jgi:5'(3')-deoxyribonucleotidase